MASACMSRVARGVAARTGPDHGWAHALGEGLAAVHAREEHGFVEGHHQLGHLHSDTGGWVGAWGCSTDRPARHGGEAGVHSCHTFSGDPRCAATTSGSSHSVRFSTFKWCIAVIVQEGLVGPPPASVRNASREGRERGGIRCSAVSRSVSLDRRIMYSTLSTEWSRVEATFNRLLLHYTYTADCLHGSVPKCCLRLRLRLRTAIIQPKSGSNAAVHKRSKDTL